MRGFHGLERVHVHVNSAKKKKKNTVNSSLYITIIFFLHNATHFFSLLVYYYVDLITSLNKQAFAIIMISRSSR